MGRMSIYWKMNGLGNDFVILDHRSDGARISTELAMRIAARGGGLGCDQVIALEPSRSADTFMRIFNADGSEVAACGNASRCVAVLLAKESGKEESVIETRAGLLGARAENEEFATVDIGAPRFAWSDIPTATPLADTTSVHIEGAPEELGPASLANVGNPHCIFWTDDIARHDLARIGPVLERHPLFPERANISLAHVTSRESIDLKVWERGAGLTLACGTAACAATVAAVRKNLTRRRVNVSLPGGTLAIEWRDTDGHILMAGPVALEHSGVLDLAGWSETAS